MTKIWKEVGMQIRAPDGHFIMPDDPLFDPIYRHIASRGMPLLSPLGGTDCSVAPLGSGERALWLLLEQSGMAHVWIRKPPYLRTDYCCA